MNCFIFWLLLNSLLNISLADSVVAGRNSPDGVEALACDLPSLEHLKNTGGSDGSGLCVFTSVEHSGRWQNEELVRGFQQKMRKEPGGGYPEKLDRMMARYCPGVSYLQYTGSNSSLLKIALRTGRMPAVTYGFSPRYGNRIAHMVNLVHFSDRWACVLDNNFPGDDKYEWMNPQEFEKRWISGNGGWAVFLLNPPPPPVPAKLVSNFSDKSTSPLQMPAFSFNSDKDFENSAIENFGIEQNKIPIQESYWLNGTSVTSEQAFKIFQNDSTLNDDSKLPRLTLIGSKQDCDKVLNDLNTHPALLAYKGKMLVQGYRPSDWAVRDIGFNLVGTPRIVFQAAPDETGKGLVLHSQGDYEDGAIGLAQGLRKADPNYDPSKDVDRRKIFPLQAPDWAGNWMMLGVAVLSLIAGRFSLPILGIFASILKYFIPVKKGGTDLDTLLDQLLKKIDERNPKQP